MNKWKCDHPGCTNSCIGSGTAFGLRTIGWTFIPGGSSNQFTYPTLFCPVHNPDGLNEDQMRDTGMKFQKEIFPNELKGLY